MPLRLDFVVLSVLLLLVEFDNKKFHFNLVVPEIPLCSASCVTIRIECSKIFGSLKESNPSTTFRDSGFVNAL